MSELKYSVAGAELEAKSTREILKELGIESDRTVTRHAALLCLAASRVAESLKSSGVSLDRVGLYCVADKIPLDSEVIELFSKVSGSLYTAFRTNVSPLRFLRLGVAIEPAWASIVTGIRGPVRCFTDDEFGVQQACEQAYVDFQLDVISAAVMVAATANEEGYRGSDSACGVLFSEAPSSLEAAREAAQWAKRTLR